MRLRDALEHRLADLDQAGLRRQLQTLQGLPPRSVEFNGHPVLSFASNDYLGLARHPDLLASLGQATSTFGAGATASRLVCGSLPPHALLEHALATFKSTEAALAFSSGYATALGVIPALVGPGDIVLLDRLAHACLVDGARLSGARLRVFRHNDPDDLRRLLEWAARHSAPPPAATPASSRRSSHTLIVTESVFSMDGDRAPLAALADLKDRYGAWLLVDEAHATGLIGPRRQGLIEALGLTGRVEVTLGTLGKALGCAGGFVAGERVLRDYLIHRARSFMFSTAPPPGVAAAAARAVELVASEEGARRATALWERITLLHQGLVQLGWPLPPAESAILPLIVGPETHAVRLAAALRDEGLLVPAIRYPTVSRGRARLRLSVSADHHPDDVARLLAALARAQAKTGITPAPLPSRTAR